MKKVLIALFFIGFLSLSVNAQDYKTSLGLRAGYPLYGASVKHFVNKKNALEGILAWSYSGLVITGLFENEHWTGHFPSLNWYWGVGAHVGFWDSGNNPNVDVDYTGPVIGADAVIGLEYTFDDIPLNLSLDLLPTVNLIGSTGWGGINGALTVRYVF